MNTKDFNPTNYFRDISKKQNRIKAGSGIIIEDDVVSVDTSIIPSQESQIKVVKKNGTNLPVTDNSVNITFSSGELQDGSSIIKKNDNISNLNNDANYISAGDVQTKIEQEVTKQLKPIGQDITSINSKIDTINNSVNVFDVVKDTDFFNNKTDRSKGIKYTNQSITLNDIIEVYCLEDKTFTKKSASGSINFTISWSEYYKVTNITVDETTSVKSISFTQLTDLTTDKLASYSTIESIVNDEGTKRYNEDEALKNAISILKESFNVFDVVDEEHFLEYVQTSSGIVERIIYDINKQTLTNNDIVVVLRKSTEQFIDTSGNSHSIDTRYLKTYVYIESSKTFSEGITLEGYYGKNTVDKYFLKVLNKEDGYYIDYIEHSHSEDAEIHYPTGSDKVLPTSACIRQCLQNIDNYVNSKQNKLIPGTNISIANNVISSFQQKTKLDAITLSGGLKNFYVAKNDSKYYGIEAGGTINGCLEVSKYPDEDDIIQYVPVDENYTKHDVQFYLDLDNTGENFITWNIEEDDKINYIKVDNNSLSEDNNDDGKYKGYFSGTETDLGTLVNGIVYEPVIIGWQYEPFVCPSSWSTDSQQLFKSDTTSQELYFKDDNNNYIGPFVFSNNIIAKQLIGQTDQYSLALFLGSNVDTYTNKNYEYAARSSYDTWIYLFEGRDDINLKNTYRKVPIYQWVQINENYTKQIVYYKTYRGKFLPMQSEHAFGIYEWDSDLKQYVITSDTVVDNSKSYYIKTNEGWTNICTELYIGSRLQNGDPLQLYKVTQLYKNNSDYDEIITLVDDEDSYYSSNKYYKCSTEEQYISLNSLLNGNKLYSDTLTISKSYHRNDNEKWSWPMPDDEYTSSNYSVTTLEKDRNYLNTYLDTQVSNECYYTLTTKKSKLISIPSSWDFNIYQLIDGNYTINNNLLGTSIVDLYDTIYFKINKKDYYQHALLSSFTLLKYTQFYMKVRDLKSDTDLSVKIRNWLKSPSYLQEIIYDHKFENTLKTVYNKNYITDSNLIKTNQLIIGQEGNSKLEDVLLGGIKFVKLGNTFATGLTDNPYNIGYVSVLDNVILDEETSQLVITGVSKTLMPLIPSLIWTIKVPTSSKSSRSDNALAPVFRAPWNTQSPKQGFYLATGLAASTSLITRTVAYENLFTSEGGKLHTNDFICFYVGNQIVDCWRSTSIDNYPYTSFLKPGDVVAVYNNSDALLENPITTLTMYELHKWNGTSFTKIDESLLYKYLPKTGVLMCADSATNKSDIWGVIQSFSADTYQEQQWFKEVPTIAGDIAEFYANNDNESIVSNHGKIYWTQTSSGVEEAYKDLYYNTSSGKDKITFKTADKLILYPSYICWYVYDNNLRLATYQDFNTNDSGQYLFKDGIKYFLPLSYPNVALDYRNCYKSIVVDNVRYYTDLINITNLEANTIYGYIDYSLNSLSSSKLWTEINNDNIITADQLDTFINNDQKSYSLDINVQNTLSDNSANPHSILSLNNKLLWFNNFQYEDADNTLSALIPLKTNPIWLGSFSYPFEKIWATNLIAGTATNTPQINFGSYSKSGTSPTSIKDTEATWTSAGILQVVNKKLTFNSEQILLCSDLHKNATWIRQQVITDYYWWSLGTYTFTDNRISTLECIIHEAEGYISSFSIKAAHALSYNSPLFYCYTNHIDTNRFICVCNYDSDNKPTSYTVWYRNSMTDRTLSADIRLTLFEYGTATKGSVTVSNIFVNTSTITKPGTTNITIQEYDYLNSTFYKHRDFGPVSGNIELCWMRQFTYSGNSSGMPGSFVLDIDIISSNTSNSPIAVSGKILGKVYKPNSSSWTNAVIKLDCESAHPEALLSYIVVQTPGSNGVINIYLKDLPSDTAVSYTLSGNYDPYGGATTMRISESSITSIPTTGIATINYIPTPTIPKVYIQNNYLCIDTN